MKRDYILYVDGDCVGTFQYLGMALLFAEAYFQKFKDGKLTIQIERTEADISQ